MNLRFHHSLLALIISPFIAKPAISQIVPDNTLADPSQVQINGANFQINNGTTRGVNLYHSFLEFSVPTNGQAVFTNGSSIENIITRVTGNSISNIDGLIQTNGSANLFLINPNGIIFGENASLKINGSFTATTADSLQFSNDTEFSATNPQEPPLLTVSITPGLQYGTSSSGVQISNLATLSVGQDLNLVADQLLLQGTINAGNDIQFTANSNVQIQDSNITAVGGNIDINTAQLNLTNTEITTKATTEGGEININVSDSTTLTNSKLRMESIFGETPGNITINTQNLTLENQSLIAADQQGTININANTFTLNNESKMTTTTDTGTSGNIELVGLTSLQLNNSSEISANTENGAAGDIFIQASDFIQLDNDSRIASEANGGGNAGSVKITTHEFNLIGSSEMNVSSGNDAGFVRVQATKITLDEGAKIVANAGSDVGGEIELLDLTSLQLSNSSKISASTTEGIAGDITIQASDFVNLESGSSILSEANGNTGDAGFIKINTNEFTMTGASTINVNSPDVAGVFSLIAKTVSLDEDSKIVANAGSDTGGEIELLNLTSLQLSNSSRISASTTDGIAGDITIEASDFVSLDTESSIFSQSTGSGDAGFIKITTNELTMTGTSIINVNSPYDAGIFRLTAKTVSLDGDSRIVANAGSDIGGEIELLNLTSLQLNNSIISASTTDGTAGDVIIQASDFVTLENSSRIASEANGTGNAGFVEITTGQFTLVNSEINVNSRGQNAGDFRLFADTAILDQEAQIEANTFSGVGGNIQLLNLTSLQLNNSSEIIAITTNGQAGDITITTSDVINLDTNASIASSATSIGKAGSLNITTNQFNFSNGANINVNSQNNTAGNLIIYAQSLTMNGDSKIAGNTSSGTGGYIQINDLTSLNLNNSSITTNTTNGLAGDLDIGSDIINLDNSSVISSEATGTGNAGNIDIITKEFALNNQSQITVRSQNNTSGSLIIAAETLSLDNKSQINGETSSGIGGNIQLENLTSLELDNQSFISASTVDGEAGDIVISASNFITLDNSSRIESAATGTGSAGFIEMTTGKFTISNNAVATVSSPQGEAGYLTIIADNLFLNQGQLLAETGAGESGENAIINLFLQDLLLLRNNSTISAQAFNTAQGGNINIDVSEGFVVAFPFENSDINANANQGDGGIIDIITQSIYGTEFRDTNTSQSDITASSQFGVNGEVNINTLDIDPTQGILSLPAGFLDVSNQIAQGCGQDGKVANQNNQFIITGKGGLPSKPNDLLTGTDTLVDLVDILPNSENQSAIKNYQSANNTNDYSEKIVEAQGWIVDTKGNVHLVANVDKVQPQSPILNPTVCSH